MGALLPRLRAGAFLGSTTGSTTGEQASRVSVGAAERTKRGQTLLQLDLDLRLSLFNRFDDLDLGLLGPSSTTRSRR
jgi:hypothetical protein